MEQNDVGSSLKKQVWYDWVVEGHKQVVKSYYMYSQMILFTF